jgi:hypothetical protein
MKCILPRILWTDLIYIDLYLSFVCLYDSPGGDGFDPPGTAAARAEAARLAEQEAALQRERAAQHAREQEAAALAQPQEPQPL